MGGQRQEPVEQPARYLVGIDLGGTKIHAAVATLDGEIVADIVEGTGDERGSSLPGRARGITDRLLETAGIEYSTVVGVGMGIAGVIDPGEGELRLAPNLGDVDGVDLRALFDSAFECTVTIDNDVNLAALGEWRYGHARGCDDFVVISVGTGIGMGIVANGQLVRGAFNAAGEIGFLPFGADPLDEENQIRGPLEEAVAGDAIARRYNDQNAQSLDTSEVFDRAAAGDGRAAEATDIEARYVAQAIVSVKAVLDPALVVISGGVGTRAGFADQIVPWLSAFGVDGLDIRTSILGNGGAVRGAIELARTSYRVTPLCT